MNHGLKKDAILEGQTILLPSSKLSVRDREILDGVKGKGKYRAYPVRKGEKIEDIIGKRGIKMAEVEKLNEGVDLASLQGELDPSRGSNFPSTFHQRRELTLFFCCCSLSSDQAPAKQVHREGEGDARGLRSGPRGLLLGKERDLRWEDRARCPRRRHRRRGRLEEQGGLDPPAAGRAAWRQSSPPTPTTNNNHKKNRLVLM